MPGGGGRVQRGNERPPLVLIGALGEQLLELVDHQQQPRAAAADRSRCAVAPSGSPAGPRGRARAAWRAVSANPAGSASSPRRTAAASAPASGATRTASSSSGARVGVNTRHGHDAASGADASPAPRIRGSTPARSSDDLPAPDTPDTTSRPAPCRCRDIRSSTSAAAASRPKKNAASCSSNALSPRYGELLTRGAAAATVPACSRAAASASAASARPRAAATNSSRAGPARPSASASSTAVSLRAVRLTPRSRSLTDRGLSFAASASSS